MKDDLVGKIVVDFTRTRIGLVLFSALEKKDLNVYEVYWLPFAVEVEPVLGRAGLRLLEFGGNLIVVNDYSHLELLRKQKAYFDDTI